VDWVRGWIYHRIRLQSCSSIPPGPGVRPSSIRDLRRAGERANPDAPVQSGLQRSESDSYEAGLGSVAPDARAAGKRIPRDPNLTHEHPRIAMPHFTNCPWCNAYIWDWFHEWYPPLEHDEIKYGKLAMDCPDPACRRPVTLNKGRLVRAPGDLPMAQRSVIQAEKWATDPRFGNYATLEDFLVNAGEQSRAKYFRSGYWPHVNV
jgi:hypothetical protein